MDRMTYIAFFHPFTVTVKVKWQDKHRHWHFLDRTGSFKGRFFALVQPTGWLYEAGYQKPKWWEYWRWRESVEFDVLDQASAQISQQTKEFHASVDLSKPR